MGIKTNGILIDECLDKIKEGESFFVLRGQDISSPQVILFWLILNSHLLNTDKSTEALACMEKMIEMRKAGLTKAAD